MASLTETLDEAAEQLAELGGAAAEVVCDKGYHSNKTMKDLADRGVAQLRERARAGPPELEEGKGSPAIRSTRTGGGFRETGERGCCGCRARSWSGRSRTCW